MTAQKPSQADELVKAARETGELFHDPSGTPYADVVAPEPAPHHEILRIRSRTFRTFLAGLYWRTVGRPAGGQAITDAIDVLSSVALFEGPQRPVGLRIARHDGAIYLDLADDRWRVVEIDRAGWRILDRSPVPFRRTRGMLPLPTPIPGGKLDELRKFVNAVGDQFVLLSGWLVGALRWAGPYIVLVLTGEQDAAKTTTARVMRLLVDPNEVGDRALPRDEQSMAIAAHNSWIASFDNVSTLADWQSDALARLATGAGFGTRQLYSDDEETLIHVARPLILNGIGGIVTRPDLMDRAIVVDLASIPEDDRRPEDEFYGSLQAARPRLLGALLDAASSAFAREDQVNIKRLPRMADAARWITAAEGALGWPERSFLAAYRGNRANSRALTLEASPLAAPIRLLLSIDDAWEGTATQLLAVLEQKVDEAAARRRDWPKTAQALSVEIRRLAPDLRKVEAIDVTHIRLGTARLIRLAQKRKTSSQPSSPSPEPLASDANDGDDGDLHTRTNGSGDCPVCGHPLVPVPGRHPVCTNSPGHPPKVSSGTNGSAEVVEELSGEGPDDDYSPDDRGDDPRWPPPPPEEADPPNAWSELMS